MYKIIYTDTRKTVYCKKSYDVYEELYFGRFKHLPEDERHNIAAEVEGWCDLASIGETFKHDDFILICEEE